MDWAALLGWLERVLGGHGPSAWWIVVAAVLLFAAYEVVRSRVRRWLVARRLRAQTTRALGAEAWAARLLEHGGYRIIGSQVTTAYELLVDGRPLSIMVRADYVVERAGRRFVAEVKSGELAPSLETAATRRQLLEYGIAFAVDGVLLVDAEAGAIHEVVFLSRGQTRTKSRHAALAPF
jgi:hypothetical protein